MPSAYATNGYFAHGYGTKNSAMGGAGVANPQDSMAAATNPAGMVFVGSRFDVGYGAFAPHRDYVISGNGFPALDSDQASDIDFFIVPHMGFNYTLSPSSSFGVSVYGFQSSLTLLLLLLRSVPRICARS